MLEQLGVMTLVQCRAGSSRLKGKALLPIVGIFFFVRLLEICVPATTLFTGRAMAARQLKPEAAPPQGSPEYPDLLVYKILTILKSVVL